MKKINQKEDGSYNAIVERVYFTILKKTKTLLANLEQEELRFTLERTNKDDPAQMVVHEFVSPVLYFRLEYYKSADLVIHFGIEQIIQDESLSILTARFLRLLFRYTSKEVLGKDIERCLRTDWFIYNCG